MSWSIACVKNEPVITKKLAKDLLKSGRGAWDEELELFDYNVGFKDTDGKYRLYFNIDHMEHMDFVWEVLAMLCKHKIKGDICFASLEGDNAGSFWGYRFDGKGGYKGLKGEVIWTETKDNEVY